MRRAARRMKANEIAQGAAILDALNHARKIDGMPSLDVEAMLREWLSSDHDRGRPKMDRTT